MIFSKEGGAKRAEKAPEFIRGDGKRMGLLVAAGEAALMGKMMKEESKTNARINNLDDSASPVLDDDRTTRLSAQGFDAFRAQLERGEKDPEVLAARERLLKFKPVWEE